jgi:hypothetical protein
VIAAGYTSRLAFASNSGSVNPSWCLCINKVHEKCHVWLFRLHLLQGSIVDQVYL